MNTELLYACGNLQQSEYEFGQLAVNLNWSWCTQDYCRQLECALFADFAGQAAAGAGMTGHGSGAAELFSEAKRTEISKRCSQYHIRVVSATIEVFLISEKKFPMDGQIDFKAK